MQHSAELIDYYPDYFYLTHHANAGAGMQSWVQTFQAALTQRDPKLCRQLIQTVKRVAISAEFEQVVRHAEGLLADQQANYPEAIRLFQLALDITPQAEPQVSRAALLVDLARTHQTVGAYDRAAMLVNEALDLVQDGQYQAFHIGALVQLLSIQFDRGDWAAAAEALETFAALVTSAEEKAMLGVNRATWHALQGKWAPAIEQYTDAITHFQQLGRHSICARTHNQIGVVALEQRNFELCRHHFLNGLELAQQVEDWQTTNHLLGNYALLLAEEGETAQAIEVCTQAILSLDSIGDRYALATFYRLRGTFYHDAQAYQQALADHQYCLGLVEGMAVRPNIAATHINLGNVYRRLEQPDTAQAHYEQALILASALQDDGLLTSAWHGVGALFALMGENDSAEKAYQHALEHAYAANALASAASAALGLTIIAFETLDFDNLWERLEQTEEIALTAQRHDVLMQVCTIWGDLAFLRNNIDVGIQAFSEAARYAALDGLASMTLFQEHIGLQQHIVAPEDYQKLLLALQF